MEAFDIMIDDSGFVIEGGDFKIDLSDAQHIGHILKTNRGAWSGAPSLGVGALRFLKGGEIGRLNQDIKIDLKADNYKFIVLEFLTVEGETTVNINATRIK